jgi:outer membrane lipoprotein-sorting protein
MRRARTRQLAFLAVAVPATLCLAAPAARGQVRTDRPAPDASAAEIVDFVDRLLRGESSRGEMTMEVRTENWSRAMTMRVLSLGTEYALVRVLEPKKDAGTATLKSGDEIWNYLPKVDRTIKIPPSLMSASWMGSHFTNDDLVKESRLVEDYEISIAFEGARDGADVWEFDLVPKPEAPVVWGRILYQVRKQDLMPTWARYYDEDDALQRTLVFDDYRSFEGRVVPARMRMEPEDEPGEYTEVRYDELEFGVRLTPDDFSLRRLRSGD